MTSGFTGKNASNRLTHPYAIIVMLLLLSGAGFIISKAGLMAAGAFITLPVLFIFLIWIFLDPHNDVVAYLIAAFFVGAAGKYNTGVPFVCGGIGSIGRFARRFMPHACLTESHPPQQNKRHNAVNRQLKPVFSRISFLRLFQAYF